MLSSESSRAVLIIKSGPSYGNGDNILEEFDWLLFVPVKFRSARRSICEGLSQTRVIRTRGMLRVCAISTSSAKVFRSSWYSIASFSVMIIATFFSLVDLRSLTLNRLHRNDLTISGLSGLSAGTIVLAALLGR